MVYLKVNWCTNVEVSWRLLKFTEMTEVVSKSLLGVY